MVCERIRQTKTVGVPNLRLNETQFTVKFYYLLWNIMKVDPKCDTEDETEIYKNGNVSNSLLLFRLAKLLPVLV